MSIGVSDFVLLMVMGVVANRCMGGGLQIYFQTLFWESAYLLLPHIEPIF